MDIHELLHEAARCLCNRSIQICDCSVLASQCCESQRLELVQIRLFHSGSLLAGRFECCFSAIKSVNIRPLGLPNDNEQSSLNAWAIALEDAMFK